MLSMHISDDVSPFFSQLTLQLREKRRLETRHRSDVIGPLAAAFKHTQHWSGGHERRALVLGRQEQT